MLHKPFGKCNELSYQKVANVACILQSYFISFKTSAHGFSSETVSWTTGGQKITDYKSLMQNQQNLKKKTWTIKITKSKRFFSVFSNNIRAKFVSESLSYSLSLSVLVLAVVCFSSFTANHPSDSRNQIWNVANQRQSRERLTRKANSQAAGKANCRVSEWCHTEVLLCLSVFALPGAAACHSANSSFYCPLVLWSCDLSRKKKKTLLHFRSFPGEIACSFCWWYCATRQ